MTVTQWLGEDNQLGADIWEKKYRKNGESFDEFLDRVSNGSVEIRRLLAERKFVPGGRIMSNIGTPDVHSGMSNCFSRGFVEDSYDDIMQAAVDIGKTFKGQGGQGLSLSKLRPKGTPIGTAYESDGIIPFMKIFNEVTEGTSQGGARKGALLISLDAWHKEAMNFITVKSKDGMIEKANLSLEIDDEFMACVDEYYRTGEVLTVERHEVYSGHEVTWEVTPIEVFKAFVHNNYDWGDPGCIFVDRFRNYNLMELCDEYQVETCNPCGEQPLNKHGACNLSSLNLSEFVRNPYTKQAEFDMVEFLHAVELGIRYLDDIIDINAPRYPLPQQRENALRFRNAGLGVFGYATMLMKLGMAYGSDEAIAFTDHIFGEMFRAAVFASAHLAGERGAFPGYSEKVLDSDIIRRHFRPEEILELKQTGLRNCSVLSIAPTGSIATMLGESGGAEPEFAISYTRRTVGLTDNEDHYYQVYCKAAREYMALYNTSVLPSWFISSAQVDPLRRVATQAAMQNHVDTAISSTVNLPADCTEEQMAEIYLDGWKAGLKGLTIFRSGCKREAILTTGGKEEEKEREEPQEVPELKRGDIICCEDKLPGIKKKLVTGCGTMHLQAYYDPSTGDILETFVSRGSTGGCEKNQEAVSRLMSLALRGGIALENVIDQLMSCPGCSAYHARAITKKDTSRGSSCPTAIAYALRELQDEVYALVGCDEDEEEERSVERSSPEEGGYESGTCCPECGGALRFEGGCNLCPACGWSKCG